MDKPRAIPYEAGTDPQRQFIHLMRLAWDLRDLGLTISVNLPQAREPALIVQQASGPLRIAATKRDRKWVFTWGRGPDQWVHALDEYAALRIRQVAL
ncbi:hypothetical protein GCM10017600_21010 [Streptosporangium carneum]|uniref:Uncharacterized protein n=1 Tax=Streptosporangium carneum TaxID=47481 RepID=A0A9W6MC14_9ACTN|nr:hypothetical protein GCM10017600_21010 [Streptosporangium carneum]